MPQNNTFRSHHIYHNPAPIIIDEGNYWPPIHTTVQAGFIRDGHPVRMGLSCAICEDDILAFPPGAIHNPENRRTDTVAVLPCGHFFGAACIAQWLAMQRRDRKTPTCPSCRHPLVYCGCGHHIPEPKSVFSTVCLVRGGQQVLSLPVHLPPALLQMMNSRGEGAIAAATAGRIKDNEEFCPACCTKRALDIRAAIARILQIRFAIVRAGGGRIGIINSSNNNNTIIKLQGGAGEQPIAGNHAGLPQLVGSSQQGRQHELRMRELLHAYTQQQRVVSNWMQCNLTDAQRRRFYQEVERRLLPRALQQHRALLRSQIRT